MILLLRAGNWRCLYYDRMNLANAITLFRIFVCPIFLLLYVEHQAWAIPMQVLPYLLLFLLGIFELSDALDGYLARRYNQVTDLGKLLDPMADSIYRISIFLAFTLPPISLPVYLVFVFIYREAVISTLRTVCALRGFTLAARWSGKAKAALQGLAGVVITLLLIPYSLGKISGQALHLSALIIVAVAAAYSLASGVEYLVANRRYVRKLLTSRS
jgi:CDP-diacylglycerol---glycerol-3-phosphate 3-phosphatidyltransferase